MKTTKYGFTLIELLVVIAIIFIFVVLILPKFTLGHNQRTPHRSKCLNNLKQISTGAIALAMDSHERWATNLTHWNAPLVLTDIVNRGVYECPSDRGSAVWPTNCTSVFNAMGTSYAFAYTGVPRAGVSGVFDTNGPIKLSDSRLAFSSKKIIFFEPTLNEDDPINDWRKQWHSPKRGGAAAFLDGHAEFLATNYTTLPPGGSVSNRYYY